ncbi:MAG: tRNA (N6-threonylcarbamoyladenosine(37)-N6)-methyltransferase TrmO [Victivallales bacterium]|nr:tRNA (N6-threonylcarbamoyladenosine(37)-N6)-methyltransferase TrmO [Victivallales bacterium]
MNNKFEYTLHPIGFFSCQQEYTYDVPRQGVLAHDNTGIITLLPEYENTLYRLDSFSHIWVVFLFHQNTTWKPMVLPPRHTTRKVGVFASRSPYRPSRIGLSCVKLDAVKGRSITISSHDLLDGTPILDIKPYLPYADSFPDASPGWTAEGDEQSYTIAYSPLAERQLEWLAANGVPCLRDFIQDRLSLDPLNASRNRLCPDLDGSHVLAYRTWRVLFKLEAPPASRLVVREIRSGYSLEDLASPEDKYCDKETHRQFASLLYQEGEAASMG